MTDGFDPSKADPDIRKKYEQRRADERAASERGSEREYCRGKIANGKHDWTSNYPGIKKSGVVTVRVLGIPTKKNVFYDETTYVCSKCGAKYLRRCGSKTGKITKHRVGRSIKFPGKGGSGPSHDKGVYEDFPVRYPLPDGLAEQEWVS